MFEWTPEGIAKISMLVMAVPVALTVLVLITSILLVEYAKKTGIDPSSVTGKKLQKISGNMFYVAFISVGVMQLTFLVLIITAIWAAMLWLINLF